jgi:hypothetical protein
VNIEGGRLDGGILRLAKDDKKPRGLSYDADEASRENSLRQQRELER